MADASTAISIAIVSVVTALGTCFVMVCKTLRKSDCYGVHVETVENQPQILVTPTPTPTQTPETSKKTVKESVI
jgi:hypothetical protein